MITADPELKARKLTQLVESLARTGSEGELLLAFASVIFSETPDRIALALPPEALAARIQRHFQFFVHEVPPAIQLYKGVPGIHVSVRNPDEAESRAIGGGHGLPMETTVVQTHTIDAPFIFESLKNYFSKTGLRVFSAVHPILTVRRQWERVVWIGGPHEEGSKEVYCHFQIERVDSKERLRRIEHEIFSLLKCVFLAVEDFQKMRRVVRDAGSSLARMPREDQESSSARAFLEWILDDNYIFLGTAAYVVGADGLPERVHDSATGVFTDIELLPVVFPGLVEEVEALIRPAAGDDRIIGLDFCRNADAIYHLEPIDYIVARQWGATGSFEGAILILGRFARGAFAQRADRIPLLRQKLEWILEASGALPNSHVYREIRAIFNRLPIRELFYAPAAELKAVIEPIVFMTGDDEIAVHARSAAGYVGLSIAFSRLRYSYGVEENLLQALTAAFGPIAFRTSADCGAVSVLLFYFDTETLEHPVDPQSVKDITAQMTTTWEARVAAVLEAAFGEREGRRLYQRYVRPETRSGLYREVTPPEMVPDDVRHLENLEARLEVRIIQRSSNVATLHLYSMHELGLTNTLRTLQNLGLSVAEELRVPLVLPEGRKCFLYRFQIEAEAERIATLVAAEERFVEALRAIDEGRATDDALNALILSAGLSWHAVELLRTLRNHLLQIRPHYNVETINAVLLKNGVVTSALFDSFSARFDPQLKEDRATPMDRARERVRASLVSVGSLPEDEVLRAIDNLIQCSLRTNYFQSPERPVCVIKTDSRKVDIMPSPRPMFEIYVHSRLLEGIHLRGGKVARGGIRWSDRHDDFRTEILGLMKTQMLKNAVIVPVGSKGGFVLKGKVPSGPALEAYLVDRYREYISGLLDITDNMVDGKILHPPEVIRHDGDDPYLVVAADKGTAHLSDTANSVSLQYGFWLGDAFASGGSHGYDHKKLGITARGVWECVKHHFRTLGVDVEVQPFTMCGIGDMSGDVFGNGALQSRAARLVAAFNHMHIFIDPEPDPEQSYRERQRLFALGHSTWRDYNPALISKGGGVFDRSAKAIPVSPEMKSLFDIEDETASGEEMIRRILTARIDLLYNGGIGTYVKASSEENADVGDRANDRVRVNGREVRARVVAEGGNLGFTQKARLEYWIRGGLINTDALDNSGGVDLSDHEVNIKILLDALVKRGVLKGREQRNQLLSAMSEEVAELVLADNREQSRSLTMDEIRSAERYEDYLAGIEDMASRGILKRGEEGIPSRDRLLGLRHQRNSLPRPLLALLLAYSKMSLFDALIRSDLPDHPSVQLFLESYFPKTLREGFAEHFKHHTLRREIIATAVVNYAINNGGIRLISRVAAPTGASAAEAVSAYLEADRQLQGPQSRESILRAGSSAQEEHRALVQLEDALEAAARELLQRKGKVGTPVGR